MSDRRKFFGIVSVVAIIAISIGYNIYSNNVAIAEENKKSEISYQLEKAVRNTKEAKFNQLVENLKKDGVYFEWIDNNAIPGGDGIGDNYVGFMVSEDIKLMNLYGTGIECDTATGSLTYINNCILSAKSYADGALKGKYLNWPIEPTKISDHYIVCKMVKQIGNDLDIALNYGVEQCTYSVIKDATNVNPAFVEEKKTLIPQTEKFLNAIIAKYSH